MRHIAVTFLLLLLAFRIPAQDLFDTSNVNTTLQRLLGVALVPTNRWEVHSINGQEQRLKYDFDAGAFATIEAKYSLREFPIQLGAHALFADNRLSKAYRIGGFVSYKRIMLRFQTGKISGTAHWTSTLTPETPVALPFDNRYTNVDLLYLPNTPALKGNLFYYGVGYTSIKMPIQVNTLTTEGGKENQIYGTPVYDSLFSVSAYSFVFGFDLIATEAGNPEAFKGGFGLFAATQERFGGGMCTISNDAVARAEEANTLRTARSSNLAEVLIEYNLSAGIKYSHRIGQGILIAAVGYDFGGSMLANFSRPAAASTDLGFDPSINFMHHGILFRVYAGW